MGNCLLFGCCKEEETPRNRSGRTRTESIPLEEKKGCLSCSSSDESETLLSESERSSIKNDNGGSYSGSYHASNIVSADSPLPKGATRGVSTDGVDGDSFSKKPAHHSSSNISSHRGRDLYSAIKEAYRWKDRYDSPTSDFLTEMDKLFMDCQVHLSELSNTHTPSARREVDYLVQELVALRYHWGRQMLPMSVCNAFVRERIILNLGLQSYRIDCAQFFEPIPYTEPLQAARELVKIYRFSVYDLSRNEVILRYFLERSKEKQVYHHILSYSQGSERGQIKPYGSQCPDYWSIRSDMIADACRRIQSDSKR